MGIELPNGKISRTLPEQVGENTRRLNILEEYQIQSFYKEDGHLYAKRVSGEAIDLGLLVDVSGFSINENQHLIVNYNDGTTQDLGAIFSGNVNISGNLTADSIIENMTGYSASTVYDGTAFNIEPLYIGAVKNGNKLTFAMSFFITRVSETIDDYFPKPVRIHMPLAIWNKLVAPTGFGTMISAVQSPFYQNDDDTSPLVYNIQVRKSNYYDDYYVDIVLCRPHTLTLNQKFYARCEFTFLLSDNLV